MAASQREGIRVEQIGRNPLSQGRVWGILGTMTMSTSNSGDGFLDDLGVAYQSALKDFFGKLFAGPTLRARTASFLADLLDSNKKPRSSRERLAHVANASRSDTRDAVALGSALFAARLPPTEIRALRDLAGTESSADGADVLNALSKLEQSEGDILVAASPLISSVACAGEKKYREEPGRFLGVVAIALADCIPTWDSTRGSLAVYAKRCMETATSGEVKNSMTVRGPRLGKAAIRRIQEAEHQLRARYEREPSDSEIARDTDIPIQSIQYLRDSSPRTLSLDAPSATVDETDDGHSFYSIEEVAGSVSGYSAIENLESEEFLEQARQRVEDCLKDEPSKVVALRLGAVLGCPQLATAFMIPSKRSIRRLLLERGQEISESAISETQYAVAGVPRSPVQAREILRKLGFNRLKALLLHEQSMLRQGQLTKEFPSKSA